MLAVVLSLQAGLFLWLTGRFAESNRTPQQLADQWPASVRRATDNPALDLETRPRTLRRHTAQAFAVILTDVQGREPARRPAAELRRTPTAPAVRRWAAAARAGPDGERPRFEPPPGDRVLPLATSTTARRSWRRASSGCAEHLTNVVNSSTGQGCGVPSGPPPMEVALRELGPVLTRSGLRCSIGSTTRWRW